MVGWYQVRNCNGVKEKMTDQEQGESIEWQGHCVEAEAVQPHLGVLECIEHGRPSELFLASGIVVILQSELDEFPFLVRQESGAIGVILYPEIGDDRHDDSQETFLKAGTHVSVG